MMAICDGSGFNITQTVMNTPLAYYKKKEKL